MVRHLKVVLDRLKNNNSAPSEAAMVPDIINAYGPIVSGIVYCGGPVLSSSILHQAAHPYIASFAERLMSGDPDTRALPAKLQAKKTHSRQNKTKTSTQHPILTPLQRKIAAALNKLPLKKEQVYIHSVRNSHAIIVCRDVKRFELHRQGEGVVRHWADHFIL